MATAVFIYIYECTFQEKAFKTSLKDSYIPQNRMTVRVVGPLVVEANVWPSG